MLSASGSSVRAAVAAGGLDTLTIAASVRPRVRLLTVGNLYPPHHLGGYETVWRSSVEHLRRRGHDVTVLTTDTLLTADAEPDPPHVRRQLRWYWHEHTFPRRGLRSMLALERHNASVLGAHLASRPDAVLWWAMGGMSVGLIGRAAAAGVPAAAIVHDAWPAYASEVDAWTRLCRRAGPAAGAVGRLTGLPTRLALETVSRWSFNSAWLRDAMRREVPDIPAERCSVEYPGIDADRFAREPAPAWAWRLACVGRIDDRKGLPVALQALSQLPAEATLTIAGGGDAAHATELRALADRLGIRTRVHFTGAVDDPAAVYAAADAILFPVTWQEPFGLVPLEAMAVGRPVVATGTGGSAEYLDHAVNALRVTPGDPQELAAAVHRLANEPDLRARLVAEGHRTAARFRADAFNDGIERIVEGLAGEGPTTIARP